MPRGVEPLPLAGGTAAHLTESSARPSDFANASPFQTRGKAKDPARKAVMAAATVAIIAFVASMIALALMKPPPF